MRNLSETWKMILAYFISTIVYFFFVTDEDITTIFSLRDDWVATLIFSLVLLALVWILKIDFKTFLIFLGIILILFMPLTINRESLFNSLWSTPDEPKYIYLTSISLVTTVPFQGIIWALVGYGILDCLNIIFLVYLVVVCTLGYLVTKIRKYK